MAEEEQDQTHTIIAKEEQDQSGISHLEEGNPINTEEANDKKEKSKKIKRKKRLLEEANDVAKRGVCYLSRVPPRMDPLKVRQLLSEYGDIERVYLKPEGPSFQENRRKKGGFRGQIFTEGWVEFTKRSVAKRVANLLNGEKIGGKRRSMFFYDIWNIKYLSKFKWDDLTGEIAYKSAVREQKLALEISAAKRERDFYLSKVDKSRALISIQERINKKQKVQQDPDMNSEVPVKPQEPKVIRHFPQTRPVADNSSEKRTGLSKDVLAGVFGGSS